MSESSQVVLRDGHCAPPPVLRWSARVLVVLPILVAMARALASGWFPVGDNALLAVRAYDVGTRHHPLLGSWTSASLALGLDVNNPGPLYYDLAAPFMWTFGRLFGIGPGTAIAIAAINTAAALGTLLVAARIGGWRAERWMLVLVAGLAWAMGSQLLIDIWQPHALLIPFCLLVVLTVAVAAGDLWMLPWWAAVVSIVVETHLAYAYVAAMLALIVAITIGRRIRSQRGHEAWPVALRAAAGGRIARWTYAVLALAWCQPVYEQLFGPGEGNLQRLATSAGGGEVTVGLGPAVKIVAAVTALPPWWTRFGFVDSVATTTPLVDTPDGPRLQFSGLPAPGVAVLALGLLVGVLVALAFTLRAPSARPARLAVIVSLAGLVVSVAGLAGQIVTRTGLGSHQVRWIFALSLLVQVTIAWGVVELVRARWPRMMRGERGLDLALAVIVVALTLANLPFHAHDLGPTLDRAANDTLEATFDDLSGFDPGGPVVYDVDNIRAFEPYGAAVMMRFREIGVEFRFEDEGMVRQFGERRRSDGSEVGHVRQYERVDALQYRGDGCVLSLRSGVAPDAEVATDAIIAAAAEDLASGTSTVEPAGLPDDVTELLLAATAGDRDAAYRFVAQGLVPVLVDERRIAPATPALVTAAAETDAIIARVNSTLLVTASPASVC